MTDKLEILREVCARIPTTVGEFQLCLYTNNHDDKEHLAFVYGDVYDQENVLVRVHSECFTGDVLGSHRCDCGEQLQSALARVAEEGRGAVIYLRQEGRGIGLAEKLRAYNLQDDGLDTVDANLALGHQADSRDYEMASAMLEELGIRSVRLITNNPDKIEKLEALGVKITERVESITTIYADNAQYLKTKVERMHHQLPSELFSAIGLMPAMRQRGFGNVELK